MRFVWQKAMRLAGRLWRGLREWCGDAAYEQYEDCAARKQCKPLLSASEFYVEQLNRKYSRPNRCC